MVSFAEAERIARSVIPDLRSCESEPHAFIFYVGEEFYGDTVVVLKEDGRVLDLYDEYLGYFERGTMLEKRKYGIGPDRVFFSRFKLSPADCGRWDSCSYGIRVIPKPLTPAQKAVAKEVNAQYAAKMEAKKHRRKE